VPVPPNPKCINAAAWPARRRLRRRSGSVGMDEETRACLRTQEFPIHGGINGLAAGRNEVVWTPDYAADDRIPHDPDDAGVAARMDLGAMAAAPLRATPSTRTGRRRPSAGRRRDDRSPVRRVHRHDFVPAGHTADRGDRHAVATSIAARLPATSESSATRPSSTAGSRTFRPTTAAAAKRTNRLDLTSAVSSSVGLRATD